MNVPAPSLFVVAKGPIVLRQAVLQVREMAIYAVCLEVSPDGFGMLALQFECNPRLVEVLPPYLLMVG